jgi:glycosyltransferase involved in cell wall biosynthesis
VAEGITGRTTRARAVRALAATMDARLARDDRGAEFGRAGRRAALGRFSPEIVASRYSSIYERVTNDS